jgi:hypothetical protein
MSSYQRPWWLLVNEPAGLVSTVREENRDGERLFLVRGEPLVQGLIWLTWGPVAAVLAALFLTGLALVLNVREQTVLTRALFIGAFLILPALAWGGTTLLLNRLARKHLQAEVQADTREVLIGLRPARGELYVRAGREAEEQRVKFSDIRRVKVAQAIGERSGTRVCLIIETGAGPITILDESLGTYPQKVDLAGELDRAIEAYTGN